MNSRRINRRQFLKGSAATVGGCTISDMVRMKRAPYLKRQSIGRKTIVLGIDGMDPNLLYRFMSDGTMPVFKAFTERSRFGNLTTTMPPQSPVAWSSFITGTNPGGHGIFDFVHRDPKAFMPYLSTTRSYDATSKITVGRYTVPLGSGSVDLMRKGRPFWSILEEQGIPASIFSLPANFPVVPDGDVRAISGMGTPDLLGSYGTFTYYTEVDVPDSEHWNGGRVIRVRPVNHYFSTTLEGPTNPFKSDNPAASMPLTIARDPWDPTLKIDISGQQVVLKQGEWSEWVPLKFDLIPLFAAVGGMVRFYAKQIHPTLKLYVSPINIDPMDPTLPISSPTNYSRELTQAVGRFYTQGFPADQKAVAFGVLSDDEYFHQAKIVLEENFKILDYQLSRFDDGFFFFYFSSIDQNCHMLWRLCDPAHPMYRPEASEELKNSVRYFYKRMDEALKMVLGKVDANTTLMVLSDHGFGTFERELHLSRWLVDQGYTVLKDPDGTEPGDMYDRVDWEKTTAYALGINGIYLNLKDREPHGIVTPDTAGRIRSELVQKLPRIVDPIRGGAQVVRAAYDGTQLYRGPYLELAPDVVVGYERGYRVSDEAVLGKFPLETLGDRTNKWSADHCFDPSLVPGVLLTNKTEWVNGNPAIWDLAPTILKSFGIEPPAEMEGKPVIA